MAPTNKTVLDVLIDARALIEKPENWAQGGDARFHSTPTCAGLALVQTSDDVTDEMFAAARSAVCIEMGGNTDSRISLLNDTHTHAEVISAFDAAISAERAKVVA